MSERCANCLHWEQRNVSRDDVFDDDERPDVMAEYERWGYCAKASSGDGQPKDASTRAYAKDYETYKADLLTRENFGCVQWELKVDG